MRILATHFSYVNLRENFKNYKKLLGTNSVMKKKIKSEFMTLLVLAYYILLVLLYYILCICYNMSHCDMIQISGSIR